MIHTPVLLQDVINAIDPQKGKKYIDATFGLGGHSYQIAKSGAEVLSIDYDSVVVERLRDEARSNGVTLVCGNYAQVYELAKENGFVPCDAILFDLGLSMEQLKSGGRGFSFKELSDPLDMRLNQDIETNAAEIIKSFSKDELYEILVSGSEELNSRAIVQSIIRTRRLGAIETVGDLNKAIESGVLARGSELEKILRKVYQALFIYVNNEFENIRQGLAGAYDCLLPGGKILVIGFHTGHERVVKRFSKEKGMKMKVVKGKGGQIAKFERSATLRILTKI